MENFSSGQPASGQTAIPAAYKKNKNIVIIALAGVAIVVAAGYFYFFTENGRKFSFFSAPEYVQAYTLVNDTISQNAGITIHLPEGVGAGEAKAGIVFTPAITGSWREDEADNSLTFQPEEPLKLGRYYTVTLNVKNGTIGKDFLAVEDPKIVSIFPKNDAEAHERSEITIIFNRPMVPLTTLDELEKGDIPIEITPATAGRFKWIGTHTLQFIPKDTLVASANYAVKVKPGFVSVDGLAIDSFEHKFITRPLRYEYVETPDPLIYNQPLRVKFNQPVNLEKTRAGITVEDLEKKQNINFIAEYGTARVYKEEKEK